MNKILAHSMSLSLYGSFIYQFMNPSSPYVGWVENYAILYAIISTIVLLILMVAILGLHIIKKEIIDVYQRFTNLDLSSINKSVNETAGDFETAEKWLDNSTDRIKKRQQLIRKFLEQEETQKPDIETEIELLVDEAIEIG